MSHTASALMRPARSCLAVTSWNPRMKPLELLYFYATKMENYGCDGVIFLSYTQLRSPRRGEMRVLAI